MTRNKLFTVLIFIVLSMLVACGSNDVQGEQQVASNTQAMVEGVKVELRNGHYYAAVAGTYSDACTRISDVQQDVEGNTIKISLSTAAPPEVMCAQMLAPFEVEILLETGGLVPGEYVLDVNDVTTTFILGE